MIGFDYQFRPQSFRFQNQSHTASRLIICCSSSALFSNYPVPISTAKALCSLSLKYVWATLNFTNTLWHTRAKPLPPLPPTAFESRSSGSERRDVLLVQCVRVYSSVFRSRLFAGPFAFRVQLKTRLAPLWRHSSARAFVNKARVHSVSK